VTQTLAIFVGGGAGSLLRWLLAGAVQRAAGGVFPWGIFAVNAIGSLVIGFLFVWMIERSTASDTLRLALTVGLLGGFTTFSSFSLDSVRLLAAGVWGLALANIVGQVLLCLLLTWLGIQIARAI